MCGIVGYIGQKQPVSILLDGLKSLEYRGYDSAGIALKNNDKLQIIKSVGKISNLEKKLDSEKLIEANMGIAHTRWATHGEANETNAHPHICGNITLVHNGIIENAKELKEELMSKGVEFKSDTDTEVITALINYYYDNDIVEAINKSIKKVRGSYALAIMVKDDDRLYALRKDSPLIIGYGKKEMFIASDIAAIINYTNRYVLLDEGEVAVLTSDTVSYLKNGKNLDKKIVTTDIGVDDKDKCGYDHYMLKEIMEEPVVLEKTVRPFIEDINNIPDLSKYKKIHIVACGSAYYAGMIGKSLFEEKSEIEVTCEVASEYRYKKVFFDNDTLVILISQSGETADTIAAMRKAKDNGIDTLAIVNVKTSTIARESDKQIFIEAGPEIAVATTKAYILQVAVLSLLSYRLAQIKNLVEDSIIEELKTLPGIISDVLDKRDKYFAIAEKIYKHEKIFFIGRKVDYAMCLEGSLKLKEVSYIHSEAYQAGELKHGTISLIDEGTPVFSIVTDDEIKEKTISNICEVASRGATTILVSNRDDIDSDYKIIVPKVNEFLQPLLIVPTLQLIAYEVARLRGCDIDKPKNLAKSVTVE